MFVFIEDEVVECVESEDFSVLIVNGYVVGLGEFGSWEVFYVGFGFVLVR